MLRSRRRSVMSPMTARQPFRIFGDAIHRNLNPPCKLGRAHAESVEVLAQRLAGEG